jgi:hypothetical protein
MDADYAVQLIVPAEAGSARLARLIAAALATDASFTVDDTEDLRVAVSELVALLVEGAENPADHISLTYRRTSDVVEVTGERSLQSAGAGGGASVTDGAEPDDLALEILRVVVDEHDYTHNGTGRHFRLVKRARTE